MPRKFAAMDIETANDVPGPDFDWKPHRPLGIACAAVLRCGAEQADLFHGRGPDGTPAARMSKAEVGQLVQELVRLVADGCTLLTWNGLGFDLDILQEESGMLDECRKLAWDHVDAMFHVFCDRGFPVGLDKAAQGLGIPGKPAGMSGWLAPKLWAEGRHQEVLDYVAQDVRITMQVALACEERKRLDWITRKGTWSSMRLPRGWLTVRQALGLPEPDTSWMSDPMRRDEFTRWLDVP
jgi:hypothetical protein